jgi:hypothetical protein
VDSKEEEWRILYGRWITGNAVSSTAEGMDVLLFSYMLCKERPCDELIPRLEEFYRLWFLQVSDLET